MTYDPGVAQGESHDFECLTVYERCLNSQSTTIVGDPPLIVFGSGGRDAQVYLLENHFAGRSTVHSNQFCRD